MNAHAPRITAVLGLVLSFVLTTPVGAQVKAQVAAGIRPAWTKGIEPISAESYWNAVECGKQGGANPPCVFWDTGLCKNSDFTLAMYTPYKAVAYEVWRVARAGGTPPEPDYGAAQRTRITVGVTPVRGSTNPIASVVVKRGGRTIEAASRSVAPNDARFTFDYPAFAATAPMTLELVGKERTISCEISQSVLALFR